MQKEIYILACQNEDGNILSLEPFGNVEDAKAAMKKQLDLEAFDAEKSGYNEDDIEKAFSENSATLYFGGCERYHWEIRKASFPEPQNTPAIRKPDLSEMHADIVAFVEKHQGEKGFILTDDPDKSTIYGYVYLQSENRIEEFEIKAVRVHEGEIQVIIDTETVRYDEEAVKESCTRSEKLSFAQLDVFGDWLPVDPDEEDIEYVPTIFRIAEGIEEYA